MTCPECSSDRVNTRFVAEEYEYQDGRAIPRRMVKVHVIIPKRECLFCGLEWTDGDADAVRSRAVAKALREGDDDVRF